MSALLVARSALFCRMLYSSCLLIASLLVCFALVRQLVLLFSLMDLGGVRSKMTSKNCERIKAVKQVKVYNCYGEKTVNGYFLKTLVRRRTTVFLNGTKQLLYIHV